MGFKRQAAARRVVVAALVGNLAIALAGCGGGDTGSGTADAAATSNASAGSTTATVGAGTASPSTSGTASTTTTSTSTVTQPAPPSVATASSVTLGWVPPTQNSDGSPITDLAGYNIHYGTTSSEYTQTIALQNAGLTRYVIDNLPSGTYYFAITAYNSLGVESALSGEIATTVD